MPRLSKARRELLTTMMKDTIFEATSSVLCQHGVDGTTMNRVAEAANLAKSSLYDYFPEQRRVAGVRGRPHHGSRRPSSSRTLPILDLPATEKLREIVRKAFASVERHRALLLLLLRDDLRDVAESSKLSVRSRVVQTLSAVFEQGMAEGQFRREDTARAIALVHGLPGRVLRDVARWRTNPRRSRIASRSCCGSSCTAFRRTARVAVSPTVDRR